MDTSLHPSALATADGAGAGDGAAALDRRPANGAEVAALRHRVAELEAQVAHLTTGLAHRPPIEHVVGMLMLLMSADADRAWEALAQVSQTTNRKVRDIAAAVAEQVASGEGLPADVVDALRDVLPPAVIGCRDRHG